MKKPVLIARVAPLKIWGNTYNKFYRPHFRNGKIDHIYDIFLFGIINAGIYTLSSGDEGETSKGDKVFTADRVDKTWTESLDSNFPEDYKGCGALCLKWF